MEFVAHLPTTESPRRLARSTAAVIAGLLTVIATHTGTDALMHATSVFPPIGEVMSGPLFALALAYRCAFTVLGGYVAARLAPHKPLKHALVLGGIGSCLSLVGLAATVGRGPEYGPIWYGLLLAFTSVPCTWLGSKLRTS